MDKILYDGKSGRARYQVVERLYNGRPARLLLSGNAAPQSGLALDDNPELLFDYNQRFLEVALSLMPQSILVIGGGAFTLPKALVERFSEMKIDVVEVDPLLPQLARQYFGLPKSPNLNVFTQDGREYINARQSHYDLIIVDAFDEFEIPRPLLTVQAAAEYARLLEPNGTIAVNFIAAYGGIRPTLAHQLLATFRESFRSVALYPADPYYPKRDEQNYLLIASHETEPNLDYLQSSSAALPSTTTPTSAQLMLHDE